MEDKKIQISSIYGTINTNNSDVARIISDPYMDKSRNVLRLINEWVEHDGVIIAFDFDNTVYDYHRKGFVFDKVVKLLKECKEYGCTLVVFTSSASDKYEFIRTYLEDIGIDIDYINETPANIPFGHTGAKIYYNIFLDDRAGLESAYEILDSTLNIIKSCGQEIKNKHNSNDEV